MRPRRSGSARSELLIAIALAALLFGFLLFAFLNMGRKTAKGSRHGIVTEKLFTPQKEQQVTIGAGGVRAQEVDGEYRLTVRVGDGEAAKDYHIWVDPRVYAQHKVGDKYFFVEPPTALASPRPSPAPAAGATPQAIPPSPAP